MKTILAFGDSLTWGHDPVDGSRHPRDSRWPVVLEKELGDVEVISEGLCGRNTSSDDHAGNADRNATRALPVALASHAPLDLVILMLGTNDLKPALCGVAEGAIQGMKRLIRIVQTFPFDKPGCSVPALLIVAPPPLVPGPGGTPSGGRRIEESLRFAPEYAALARTTGTAFFDAGTVTAASPVDGTHLDAEATRRLGRALTPICRDLIGN